MINAVLVFNNAGQPRLTKFYTQIVRSSYAASSSIPYILISKQTTTLPSYAN